MSQFAEKHKTERERRGLPMEWHDDRAFGDRKMMPFKVARWRQVQIDYTDEQAGLIMRAILYAWHEQREFPDNVLTLTSQHIRGIFNCDVRKLRRWWTDETTALVREMVSVRAPLKRGLRNRIFEMDKGRCAHCGTALDPNDFHVDHLVPVSQGGSSRGGNLAASCPDCNRRKGARQ